VTFNNLIKIPVTNSLMSSCATTPNKGERSATDSCLQAFVIMSIGIVGICGLALSLGVLSSLFSQRSSTFNANTTTGTGSVFYLGVVLVAVLLIRV
jgi:hypothetical protein